MFFELHKSNDEYHVEIYYKSYRGEDPVPLEPLSIPNCGKKCPLEKLYEIYKDILPTEDFDTECHVPDEGEMTYGNIPNKGKLRSSRTNDDIDYDFFSKFETQTSWKITQCPNCVLIFLSIELKNLIYFSSI